MLDHPVFVVTTQADGHPAGCLVSFATQTSVQPPSFMVGLPRSTGTSEVASRSEHLAVHVLSQRQHVLAELFGSQTEEEGQQVRPLLVARWPLWNADSRRRGRLVHR